MQRKANSILGIFSSYGVAECKQLFWRSFSWGKKFGQRQTMFDMLFLGFRAMGRDESMIEYLFSVGRICVYIYMCVWMYTCGREGRGGW